MHNDRFWTMREIGKLWAWHLGMTVEALEAAGTMLLITQCLHKDWAGVLNHCAVSVNMVSTSRSLRQAVRRHHRQGR